MSAAEQAKPTQLIEVENDLLQQILETTRAAKGQLSVAEKETIARHVEESHLCGMTQAQVFTLGLLAEARGIPFISAMMRYHLIPDAQGILRPSLRADAMQAEFQEHGGRVRWLVTTDKEVKAEFSHPLHHPDPFTIVLTIDEMNKKGITQGKNGTKVNWRQWPRQMLRARAISEGIRAIDPGIVVGIYTPEEVSDFTPTQTTARVVETAPVSSQAAPPGNGERIAVEAAMMQEPEPREPGCDDEPIPKKPSTRDRQRKAKERNGAWLEQALESRDAEVNAWFTWFGGLRGFPKDKSMWSVNMVSEAIEARKGVTK